MDLPGLLTEIAFRHLWQGAIIIGIVSLLLSARQVWSAEHRSWMWLSALVLTAALPFITLIDLPAFEFGPPAEPVEGTLLVPVSQRSAPFVQESMMAPISAPLLALLDHLPMVLILSALAGTWMGVGVWKLFRLAAAARKTGSLRDTLQPCLLSTDMVPGNWPDSVEILQSDAVETPMAMGFFNCRVVLPASLVTTLPAHQMRHVLSHELAHIRRGDLQFAIIERLIQALFWWSPLAWFIGKQLREEREMACDDRAVRMNGCSRQYASALLESVTLLVADRRGGRCDMLALSAFDHHSRTAFRTRIRRLIGTGYRAQVALGRTQIASASAAVIAVLALFMLSPRHVFETASIAPQRPFQTLAALDNELTEFLLPDTASVAAPALPARGQWRSDDVMFSVPDPAPAPMSRFADLERSNCESDGAAPVDPVIALGPAAAPSLPTRSIAAISEPAAEVRVAREVSRDVTADTRRERIARLSGDPRIEIETEILDEGALDDMAFGRNTAEFVIVTRGADGALVKRVIRHSDARDITITAGNGSTMSMTIREDENGNQVLSMSGGNSKIVTIE